MKIINYCSYYDCGWCYAPKNVNTNALNGACMQPKTCPHLRTLNEVSHYKSTDVLIPYSTNTYTKPMNAQQLQQEITKTQEQLKKLQEQLEVAKVVMIENAQPGQVLSDGCIVVYRQENLVLIAAPKETEVTCKRDDIWERAFTKLECKGFDRITWHIPSVNELKLAGQYLREPDTTANNYWSSDIDENHSVSLYYGAKINSTYSTPNGHLFKVRAFKWVVL